MSTTVRSPNWSAELVARDYSEFSRQAFWTAYHWKAAVALYRSGLAERGGDALDVGCGPGWLGIVAKKMCPALSVVGVDRSEEMVRTAADNAAEEGVEATYRVGDAETLEFPDESFDLVTSFAMLRLLGDPARALAEARRILRPGGTVYYSDILRPVAGTAGEDLYNHPHPAGREFLRQALEVAFDEASVRELLERSGQEGWECRVGGLGGYPPRSREVLEWVKDGFPLRELYRTLPRSEWAELMSEHWIHVYFFKK